MKDDWCCERNVHLGMASERKVKRTRCTKCGKRYVTFVKECDDPGCFHYYLPKHKKPVKKKRKVSKDVSFRR